MNRVIAWLKRTNFQWNPGMYPWVLCPRPTQHTFHRLFQHWQLFRGEEQEHCPWSLISTRPVSDELRAHYQSLEFQWAGNGLQYDLETAGRLSQAVIEDLKTILGPDWFELSLGHVGAIDLSAVYEAHLQWLLAIEELPMYEGLHLDGRCQQRLQQQKVLTLADCGLPDPWVYAVAQGKAQEFSVNNSPPNPETVSDFPRIDRVGTFGLERVHRRLKTFQDSTTPWAVKIQPSQGMMVYFQDLTAFRLHLPTLKAWGQDIPQTWMFAKGIDALHSDVQNWSSRLMPEQVLTLELRPDELLLYKGCEAASRKLSHVGQVLRERIPHGQENSLESERLRQYVLFHGREWVRLVITAIRLESLLVGLKPAFVAGDLVQDRIGRLLSTMAPAFGYDMVYLQGSMPRHCRNGTSFPLAHGLVWTPASASLLAADGFSPLQGWTVVGHSQWMLGLSQGDGDPEDRAESPFISSRERVEFSGQLDNWKSWAQSDPVVVLLSQPVGEGVSTESRQWLAHWAYTMLKTYPTWRLVIKKEGSEREDSYWETVTSHWDLDHDRVRVIADWGKQTALDTPELLELAHGVVGLHRLELLDAVLAHKPVFAFNLLNMTGTAMPKHWEAQLAGQVAIAATPEDSQQWLETWNAQWKAQSSFGPVVTNRLSGQESLAQALPSSASESHRLLRTVLQFNPAETGA